MFKEPVVATTLAGIFRDFRGPDGTLGGALTREEWNTIITEPPLLSLSKRAVNIIYEM